VTWQLALQNCPMDSSGLLDRASTMWPMQAACGSPGMSSLASCVECIMVPSGFWMLMGCWASCLLCTGMFTVKKCAVHQCWRWPWWHWWHWWQEDLQYVDLKFVCKSD